MLCELPGDDARGLAEALGELEGDGGGELAEADVGRLLESDAGEVKAIGLLENGLEREDEILLDGAIHAWSSPRGTGCLDGIQFT